MTSMDQEPKFKDYKEKQAYYKQRAKQEKMFWFSAEPKEPRKKRVGLIKGRTYVKKEFVNEKDIVTTYHNDLTFDKNRQEVEQ